MRVRKAVQEINEVKEDERKIAAFFDLDGTLMTLPSLERRFFRMLRYRGEIPTRNYLLWLREALRLLPRGIGEALQANKMYLRAVDILEERGEGDRGVSPWYKGGHQADGQASAPRRRNPRLPVPAFFEQAIERMAWHAKHGHEIVLLSGTLGPLAFRLPKHRFSQDYSRVCHAPGRNGRQVDGKNLGRSDVWGGESPRGKAAGRGDESRLGAVLRVRRQLE